MDKEGGGPWAGMTGRGAGHKDERMIWRGAGHKDERMIWRGAGHKDERMIGRGQNIRIIGRAAGHKDDKEGSEHKKDEGQGRRMIGGGGEGRTQG